MILVTTIEEDAWGDSYVKELGYISNEIYYKYQEWVKENPLVRKDYSLVFITLDRLKDLTSDFADKMR